MEKTYPDVEQVNCRATPKGDLIICTLSARTKNNGVENKVMTLHYAGFTGDMKTYMIGTGLTAYRPEGKKLQCKVKDTRLECKAP